jgi:hypothetical protein
VEIMNTCRATEKAEEENVKPFINSTAPGRE